MATTFKTFLNDDVVTSRTLLHEAIPITGSVVYGTYPEPTLAGSNIKQYTHGMFQSVYDYPYLSSSANHIFDLTVGVSANTPLPGPITVQENKKRNLYNQMAQVLMGYDATGTIQRFDQDGDLVAGGVKYDDLIFINFARLLGKDEIKKGTFQITVDTVQAYNAAGPFPYNNPLAVNTQLIIGDTGAENDYRVNSPAGEYGILRVELLTGTGGLPYITAAAYNATPAGADWDPRCGLIFYQAGVIALTKDIFVLYDMAGGPGKIHDSGADSQMNGVPETVDTVLENGTIDDLATAFRNRMHKVCFNNTTELNSTIYFARVNHNDFNYSSNPTYTNDSKIQVKSQSTDAPIAYITTVGLYSADNELLAVAKLSETLRKDPTNDITLRVRLDY